jgi:uncharacterized membrane protein
MTRRHDELSIRRTDIRASQAPREAFHRRTWNVSDRLRPGPIAVGFGAAIAFVWFAGILINQALRLQTRGFDQAFFQQLAWNIGHGGGFATDLVPGSALAVHFSPILVVPALLELLWPNALLLSIFNAAALAAAVPAAYVFFRTLWPATRAAQILAVALAVVLPLAPFMQLADVTNFHPDSLALPLALLAAAAGLSGRRRAMWLLALIVLSVKEDQAYTMAVVGLLIWRTRGPLSADGRRLALASCIWGVLAFFVIIPAIGRVSPPTGAARLVTDSYYSWLPRASPGMIQSAIASPEAWGRLALLIAGLCGLPLLRPAWLALIAPPFLASVLSAHHAQAILHNHYGLLLAVPALVAAGMGGRRLLELPAKRLQRWAALAAAPGLACGALFGAVPPFTQPADIHSTSALAGLESCMAGLPPNAPVAADDNLMAPIASRPRIVLIDQATPGDYVAIDTAANPPGWVNTTKRNAVISSFARGRTLACTWETISIWTPATAG